jgi:soluble lytic murein transglycosylase-like protein
VAGWPGRSTGDWGGYGQAVLFGLLLLLSACAGSVQTGSTGSRSYAPPGPPEDPWGPYIQEAAQRFSVPQRWIRAVMRQESGGHEYLNGQPITSDAGAAGLMQIMPATYEELRERYSLGGDPYDPHDNILAGAGYISELYASYGAPAFLAAYNAGPHRVDDYLAGRGGLPNETVNYLASVAPRLGNERPMSGPLAAYAGGGGAVEVAAAAEVPRAYARAPRPGCWQDPDAAYDPDAPCRAPPVREPNGLVEAGGFTPAAMPAPPVAVQRVVARAPVIGCWHDPDAAYDPDAPCRKPPVRVRPPPAVARPVARGAWAIQLGAFTGAFTDPDQARRMAESARSLAPAQLGSAEAVLGTTAPFGGRVLYRARLAGLTWDSALAACGQLTAQRQTCVAVPPGQ